MLAVTKSIYDLALSASEGWPASSHITIKGVMYMINGVKRDTVLNLVLLQFGPLEIKKLSALTVSLETLTTPAEVIASINKWLITVILDTAMGVSETTPEMPITNIASNNRSNPIVGVEGLAKCLVHDINSETPDGPYTLPVTGMGKCNNVRFIVAGTETIMRLMNGDDTLARFSHVRYDRDDKTNMADAINIINNLLPYVQ